MELTNVSLQENMSLSYDSFIESKHCLKKHVVPGNFIVASHESCRVMPSIIKVLSESRLKSFYHNCRRMSTPTRTEVAKLNSLQDDKHFLNCDPLEKKKCYFRRHLVNLTYSSCKVTVV